MFIEVIDKIMSGEKALSFSSLKQFLNSPKEFKEYCTNKVQTEAMKEGVLFHMMVLEPEKVNEHYFVLDDTEKCKEIGGAKPRSTKAYKQWKEEQLQANAGKELVEIETMNLFKQMKEDLYRDPLAGRILKQIDQTEVPFSYNIDNFKIVGKIDGLATGKFTIDLKKVANADFQKLKWDVIRNRYNMQGGIYSKYSGTYTHYLVCIDKHMKICVIEFTNDSMDKGVLAFEYALEMFQRCAEEDEWNSSQSYYNNHETFKL